MRQAVNHPFLVTHKNAQDGEKVESSCNRKEKGKAKSKKKKEKRKKKKEEKKKKKKL